MWHLETILEGQMGRPLRGRVAVATSCPFGFPAVIETGPYLEDGTPFPTLFYLTCPSAQEMVGRREGERGAGHIRRVSRAGGSAAAFLRLLEDSYRERRRSLAPPESRVDGGAVLESGIGGSSGLGRITCLHALTAALLAVQEGRLEPVDREGEINVSEENARMLGWLGSLWCEDARCAVWKEETERVAAVDVGSNSTRLLVADVGAGAPRTVRRRAVITRLGENAETGCAPKREPLIRTTRAIKEFIGEARELGVERVVVAGTSAVRDMEAPGEVMEKMVRGLGVETRVLSGEEEGRLAYLGATLDVEGDPLLLDVGGGSTEFVRRDERGEIRVFSVDIGCVRQTDRWVTHDPPLEEELAQIRSEAGEAFAPVVQQLGGESQLGGKSRPGGGEPVQWPLLGVAGTAITLACRILGLDTYDPNFTHHALLTRDDIQSHVGRLASMTCRERRGLPCMQEGREEVIVAGGEILLTAMKVPGSRDLLVSERDILDGLVAGLVE